MEYKKTKIFRLIKQFLEDLKVSKAQRWILEISCLLIVVAFKLILTKDVYYIHNYPTTALFFSMIVSFCYTIILYKNYFSKSKCKWIPLGMCLIGTFIHTPLLYTKDGWFKSDSTINLIFSVISAVAYVISVICLYKWETISKQENKWIPFVSAILTNSLCLLLLLFARY